MSGSGGSKVEAPEFTRAQRGLVDQLTKLISGQLGTGVEAYGGPLVAQPTELLQKLFGQTGNVMDMLQTGEGYFEPAAASGDVLTSLMQPFDKAGAEDYWTKAFVNPAMDVYQKEVLPQILESFGARNALSSSGMGTALAKSGETLTTNLGAKLADILYQSEQAQKGYQLQAAGQAQNLAQLPGGVLQGMLAPAGQEYNIEQALTTEPYSKWSTEQPYANPWLQYLGGGALTTPGGISTTSGGGGILDTLLGIGGSALGGYLGGPAFAAMKGDVGSGNGSPVYCHKIGGMVFSEHVDSSGKAIFKRIK